MGVWNRAKVAHKDRPDFLRWLYGRMHSVRSVQMFQDALLEGDGIQRRHDKLRPKF